MSIETDVTEKRERGIGGSDIAAIMGDSPFMSRWDLLQYKVGIKPNEFAGNEYTRYGQTMEPKIRAHLNKIFSANFEPDYVEEDADKPISEFYHSDGCDKKITTLIEIKTTSKVFTQFDAIDMGVDFEKHARVFYRHYLEQLLYGMHLHRFTRGMLAVYHRPADMDETFDPSRLQIFFINMEDEHELMDKIISALIEFKADWGYLQNHPEAGEADLPSLYPLTASIDEEIQVGGMDLPIAWLLQNEKALTDAVKGIKDNLKKQMEEHQVSSITFSDLGIKVSYVAQGKDTTVEKFDEGQFMADHPTLWKKYQKQTVKKGKAAYVRCTVQKQKS